VQGGGVEQGRGTVDKAMQRVFKRAKEVPFISF
jgi:hypothetical protein